MKLKNIFNSGKMNKDLDERLVPKGEYRDALNVRVVGSSASDVGAIENSPSNAGLTQLNFGNNPVSIGSVSDDANNKIYWFVRSDAGSYICEYDIDNDTSTFVLKDTRSWKTNVLNFYKTNFVEANILIDIDNDKRFLFFTDGINPPRRIEIESAKLIDANTFTKYDLDVVQQPPLDAPTLSLGTSATNENNIKERFIYFAYRFKYKHGEYSALSPFSEVAFLPGTFSFDFATGLNKSMVNAYSQVDVTFKTGTSNVVEIDLVFKESNSNNVYVVQTFNKEEESIADNTTKVHTFSNSKVYSVLPEKELLRVYDNVPLTAKTQQMIGNRIVYANYTENFDLKDANGDAIPFNINATLNTSAITSPNVSKSIKSNVDYEVGMVYLDDYGRTTSVITSNNATVNVPLSASKTKNQINVSVSHLPPAFAKYYRFYVKQSKGAYETINPSIFYNEQETGYVYVQLNGNDKNKIKEGDFLIVKADTRGQKTSLVETQVLEIKSQDKNFLEADDYPGQNDPPIAQQAGLYMKIKPVGFSVSTNDYELTEFSDENDTRSSNDPLLNSQTAGTYFEGPFVYPASGSSATTADVTLAGTYTQNNKFLRITLEIDAVNPGGNDTVTVTAQTLDNDNTTGHVATGVAIHNANIHVNMNGGSTYTGLNFTFANNNGHTLGDKWTFNVRPATFPYTPNTKGFATYQALEQPSEEIRLGTIIDFVYNEYNEATQYVAHQFTSPAQYANLEEWYHESGAKATLGADITEDRIFFLRGTYGSTASSITNNTSDDLLMIIRSTGTQNNLLDSRVKIESSISYLVRQSTDILTFETRPEDKNDEVFYEIPGTYSITQGYHQAPAPGTSQDHTQAASLTLDFFNVFSWGNCVESYKIKDDFNTKFFQLENRPSTNLKDYKKKPQDSINYL